MTIERFTIACQALLILLAYLGVNISGTLTPFNALLLFSIFVIIVLTMVSYNIFRQHRLDKLNNQNRKKIWGISFLSLLI